MPVVKCKPTSPGRRFVVKVVHPDLHKGEPMPLLRPQRISLVVEITRAELQEGIKAEDINKNIDA